MDAVLTIAPGAASARMVLSASVRTLNTPKRLTLAPRSNSSSDVSWSRSPLGGTPALLNTRSTGPNSCAARAKQAPTSAALVTSTRAASTSPPTSRAASSVRSETSASTTLTPRPASSLTVARPMPDAPPVTSATLPVKPCSMSLSRRGSAAVAAPCSGSSDTKFSLSDPLGRVSQRLAGEVAEGDTGSDRGATARGRRPEDGGRDISGGVQAGDRVPRVAQHLSVFVDDRPALGSQARGEQTVAV